jgi:hypothetical protein
MIESKSSFSILCILVIFIACGAKKEAVHIKVERASFGSIINDKAMPKEPNLNEDITIRNRDYPIEIALYNDGQWFYDLPNLGSGQGTWKYLNGQIKLHAIRDMFEMNIDVLAVSENAEKVAIQFYDRFGSNFLQVEKKLD